MKSSLAVAALRNAGALGGPVGTIVRSDRGSQFRSLKFAKAYMSRAGGTLPNPSSPTKNPNMSRPCLGARRWHRSQQGGG